MPYKLIFVLQFIFCFNGFGQDNDSLKYKYQKNSALAYINSTEFSTSLNYYPELKETNIIVKEKDIRTTMAARPSWGSFFKRKSKRTYLIIIDTAFNNYRGLFDSLSFNARVGIIGHELGHISDYYKRNFFGLIGYGFMYTFAKRKIEHRTDEIAIDHKMGWLLYEYAQIAFDPKKVGKEYYKMKLKYYYSPQQLIELIQKSEIR